MNGEFSVEIVARGEGLIYREGKRTLNFNVYWSRDGGHSGHWIFEAHKCSDAQFNPVQLSPEDQKQIVARVVGYLESRGDKVEAVWK